MRTVNAYNDFQKSVYPMLTDSSRFFILRSKKERQEKNMVYAFMADGCEEVEALAVIDLLRR